MADITAYTLYSGSSGNCVYIKTPDTELLIDAGVNARAVETGLGKVESSLSRISAIFITHEHTDHTKGLEVISKKHHIPTHMITASAKAMIKDPKASLLGDLYLHDAPFTIKFGSTTVRSFMTPHDSAAAVGYTVEYTRENGETEKFGLATDIGCITETICESLRGARAAVIESNHDVEMLLMGPYPYTLKRRILAPTGHLSNEKAAELARFLAENGTKHIVLAHLSKDNNYPPVAHATVEAALVDFPGVTLTVASPDTPTRVG